jgi:hypothetical protein
VLCTTRHVKTLVMREFLRGGPGGSRIGSCVEHEQKWNNNVWQRASTERRGHAHGTQVEHICTRLAAPSGHQNGHHVVHREHARARRWTRQSRRARRNCRACRSARQRRRRGPWGEGSTRAQRPSETHERVVREVIGELDRQITDVDSIPGVAGDPTGGAAGSNGRYELDEPRRRTGRTRQALSERPSIPCSRAHSPGVWPAARAARRQRLASSSFSSFRPIVSERRSGPTGRHPGVAERSPRADAATQRMHGVFRAYTMARGFDRER